MITIQRFTTDNNLYYNYMEQLLISAFPVDEYRDLDELRTYIDTRFEFYCNIILEGTSLIGFVSYWDLGNFYYIEHFAIDPNLRNGGHGRKLLDYLSDLLQKPIVLEVELPTEEMAQRRIKFYQRQGYTLWDKEYIQPPYKADSKALSMYLMVRGDLNPETDFDDVKTVLHRMVYNIE